MNWEKIKKSHYYKEPVEHILAPAIFNLDEYDSLYRNQNDLSHQVWQDFDIKYKKGFEFFKDLREFNKDKEVICLWFFKDVFEVKALVIVKNLSNNFFFF